MTRHRRAFTILETTIALGALTTALVLLAQLVTASYSERARRLTHHEALETAANILETARATPWEKLDADWAARQRLPQSLAARLQDATLAITVEQDARGIALKRVSVNITGKDMPAVHLTGLFAARSGGRP